MTLTPIQSKIIFLLITASLCIIFFNGLTPEQFLFSGDQFFRFNGYETFINSFFLRKSIDFGVLNGWQFATQFWDTLYYLIVYYLDLTPQWAEKILFFLVLYLSMYLSFLGFNKMAHHFGILPGSLSVHVVVFWYCYNPYTLELWHGGVYNLGSGLAYSLAPLIFYQFNETIFSATNRNRILTLALSLAVASFTFWLLAPMIFFLVAYTVTRIVMQTSMWRLAGKNILILSLVYLPLVSFMLFGIMHEYFNNFSDINAAGTKNFGQMQGGIWYQLMMLFSWGIYTVWTPRSLYPFGEYFFSTLYITGIILIYLTIVIGLIGYFTGAQDRKPSGGNVVIVFLRGVIYKAVKGMKSAGILSALANKNVALTRQLKALMVIFVLSVFLAKGAQPPWGEIFLYLYDHVPFFTVFRTPDIRFGFVIVLALAILLLLVSQGYRKRFFFYSVLGITFLQAWPFFSGAAVKGENRDNLYYDRVVHMPDDYSRLADYLNQQKNQSTYILPIPPLDYGKFIFPPGEFLIGQDMLSKIVKMPFAYLAPYGGMATKTFKRLKNIIETKQYEKLPDFPIEYVLSRKDICLDCPQISKERLALVSNLVFKNSTFSLYKIRDFRPLIESPNVTFERVNPVKYRVTFNRVTEPQELVLHQNFNKNWKVFAAKNDYAMNCIRLEKNLSSKTVECIRDEALLGMDDWQYLWAPSISESNHQLKLGYANGWKISPAEIQTNYSDSYYKTNADGSLNFTLTVYYLPQATYLLFVFLSLTAGVSIITVVIFSPMNHRLRTATGPDE